MAEHVLAQWGLRDGVQQSGAYVHADSDLSRACGIALAVSNDGGLGCLMVPFLDWASLKEHHGP